MRTLKVGLGERSYDIVIGERLLSSAGQRIRDVCPKAQRVCTVDDKHVSELYAAQLQLHKEFTASGLTLAPGEQSKSLHHLEMILDQCTAAGLTRGDCLVAFGGGVVGDITGFAAATYMRGVDYIQIPTTLLAMVDSSVGGKTAANLHAGKNLVGAFWQPKFVLVDITLLDTLTDRDFFSGMAEVIKYAFLADCGLMEILLDCGGERGKLMTRMEEIVEICCRIKAGYVAEDERDTGNRMLLNLGHTVGHAYEKAGDFVIYTHGEAVAAGLVMAARLGRLVNITPDEVVACAEQLVGLHHLPLPEEMTCSKVHIAEALLLDKKGESDDINFIMLTDMHKAVRQKISQTELRAALETILPPSAELKLRLTPARLSGAVMPPPSKSQGHRMIMADCLAGGGEAVGAQFTLSEDMRATMRCMKQLMDPDNQDMLHCGESGSTLRFLIPVALALKGEGRFTGGGKLMQRPQGPYFEMFDEKGIAYDLTDNVLTVRGKLPAGIYRLRGDISSQFVTGLLYALPLLEGNSEIMLTSKLESKSYVDMTLEALEHFGIQVSEVAMGYHISGGQAYKTAPFQVERDYSQSGFFYAAACLGNDIQVNGMRKDSKQGDRVIVDYVNQLSQQGEVTLDVSDCPDLVPPLALIAALRTGERTILANAARLRIKESDRLATTTSELCKLGAQIEEQADALVITGVATLSGGEVKSHNDHRIAMMLAIAATRCEQELILSGAEAVNKSYPEFWSTYVNLGGVITR